VRDGELQDAGQRHAEQAQQHIHVQPDLTPENADTLCPTHEAIELVSNSDATSDQCRQRRAGYAQAGKWPPSKDQAGIENEIDNVRYPEQAHRNRGITSAAKDCIVEKEQQDGKTSAQANSGVATAGRNDFGRSPH
jgi:hypothetical protein